MSTISEWQKKIHTWARSKGWWSSAFGPEDDVDAATSVLVVENREHRALVAEKLLLVHSEITEAVEEYRKGNPFRLTYEFDQEGMMRQASSLPIAKPEGFPTELADAVIRILDLAEACGIDLEGEIERKMEHNLTRPQRHGGKLL